MEAGTRLQLAQFVNALRSLCDHTVGGGRHGRSHNWGLLVLKSHPANTSPLSSQGSSIDSMLFRIISSGDIPPMIRSHTFNPTFKMLTLQRVSDLLLEGDMEQPLRCKYAEQWRELSIVSLGTSPELHGA